MQANVESSEIGGIQGLPFNGDATISIKSYTSNITYGNISATVSFMGVTANLSAAFSTSPVGSELKNVLVNFAYSQSVFSMTGSLDYNSNCVPSIHGAIGSGSFALLGASSSPDASFDLSLAYFKCAMLNQTKWDLVASRKLPLIWNGATLSNTEVHVVGTVGPSNSTLWNGTLQGRLEFAGISVNGTVAFDTVTGIKDLYVGLSISSTYLDLEASIRYNHINCSLVSKNRNISGPSDPDFLGSVGQATLRIHNIHSSHKLGLSLNSYKYSSRRFNSISANLT